MAAGGFKEFVAGETLDQDEINDYLMQGVLVFAGTAARGSAIGTPVEGQFSFRTDEDALEFYDGSDWVAVATTPPSVEYVVVAGGGGCDNPRAGGAGAGGYRTNHASDLSGGGAGTEANLYLPPDTYPIVVGAGGASGSNGSDSRFCGILANGGARVNGNAASLGGGSGGGGGAVFGASAGVTYYPGNGMTGQGFSGGNGSHPSGGFAGGGGGGASEAGDNFDSQNGGNGGDGRISTIISTSLATSASVGEVSGSDVYFAGGGGGGGNGFSGSPYHGGDGGLGGGGDGTTGAGGGNGTANTGGGGGGSDDAATSTGGSGVVIFAVPTGTSVSFSGGVTQTSSTVGAEDIYIVTATSTTSETFTIG